MQDFDDCQVETKIKKNTLSPLAVVIVMFAVWFVVIGRTIVPTAINSFIGHKEHINYYSYTSSEANFARVLAITLVGDKIESNSDDENWYDKYYRALDGLKVELLKKENAENNLAADTFNNVLDTLFDGAEAIHIKGDSINLSEAVNTYMNALNCVREGAIEKKNIVILATPGDDIGLGNWELLSDKGKYSFDGLIVDPIKTSTIDVAVCGDKLLGVISKTSNKCQVDDCTIMAVKQDRICYKNQGINFSILQNGSIKESDIGKTGSILIRNQQVVRFRSADEIADLDSKVNSKTDNKINNPNKGSELVVSSKESPNIRVVLTSSNAYIHSDVVVSAEEGMTAEGSLELETASKETWSVVKQQNFAQGDTIRFTAKDNGKITVSSINKKGRAPSYDGVIEIKRVQGGYIVVNEVNLEDYVAAVVPGEMPTYYNIEAVKAQAVAARTYGASKIGSTDFRIYNADVDDTTASQVYNLEAEDEISRKATKETKGLVLASDGKLAQNKFFAASCGYTANFGEVWAENGSFSQQTPDYLRADKQYEGNEIVKDMSNEDNFKKFISLNKDKIDSYDNESPWFRWNITLNRDELEKLIYPALTKNINSNLIKFENNGLKQSFINSHITGFKIAERGEGGNVMTLEICTDNGNITVSTEYLIRCLFASNNDASLVINLNDGSKVEGNSLLPSGFFTIDEEKNEKELNKVEIIGGGCGHGVGLSQDGANQMGDEGYSAGEILAHYYPGAEIAEVADYIK